MLNGIHGHQDIERVVYGRPAGAALRAEAERLGAKRVFVTTSKSVAQSALLASVIGDLGDRYAGVYAGITAHSPRPCVIEGAARAREAGADLIVAVGGGSVIDATKVMLIALWQNATQVDDLDLYRAGKPKEGAAPPAEAIRPPADAIRMIAVPTTLSAAEFNAFAGITDPRRQIHMAEVHDCFTPTELVLMEDLGFSARGEAWKDAEAGVFDLHGELPVNTDGGLKSFGHPVGASGLRMLFECWLQLRGEAPEDRRIDTVDRGLALTHNLGGYPGEMVSFVGIFGNQQG